MHCMMRFALPPEAALDHGGPRTGQVSRRLWHPIILSLVRKAVNPELGHFSPSN